MQKAIQKKKAPLKVMPYDVDRPEWTSSSYKDNGEDEEDEEGEEKRRRKHWESFRRGPVRYLLGDNIEYQEE